MKSRASARAPGVIKLLGEHAVLYGGTAIAAAVKLYANADITKSGAKGLRLKLTDLPESCEFSTAKLRRLYLAYKRARDIKAFADSAVDQVCKAALPYAIIAGRLQEEHGAELSGLDIAITSDIPMESGCASSAACFTAYTSALASRLGKKLDDQQIIDIARDGDRITHLNRNAGSIDISTSYFGGFVASSGDWRCKLDADGTNMGLVLINTGPKRSTGEMVSYVAKRLKKESQKVGSLISWVREMSKNGMEDITRTNVEDLGMQMTATHEVFKLLGISTQKLDDAVNAALELGAYGAKLSGGGGGGMAVALANGNGIEKSLTKMGFKAIRADISMKGAKQLVSTS